MGWLKDAAILTFAGGLFMVHYSIALSTNTHPIPKTDLERMIDIADNDGREGMSLDEWKTAYKSIGLIYSRQEGRDLADTDIQSYLQLQCRR